MSRRFLFELSYLGHAFHGWQTQKGVRTVQSHLDSSLRVLARNASIKIVGASRTDAGVHARQQFACVTSDAALAETISLRSLNSMIGPDVVVHRILEVGRDYHPQYSVRSKLYSYRLIIGEAPDPFLRPFAWHRIYHLDRLKLREALEHFVGRHDFRAFTAADSSAKTFVREISKIVIGERTNEILIWFYGSGFLKQMLRNIIGTVVDYASGREFDIPAILASQDRRNAGRCAPAQGLCLERIFDVRTPLEEEQSVVASLGYY